MKKAIVLALLFVLSGVTNVVFAQSPKVVISDKKGWHKIGETTVDFTKDRDEITVLGADRFASQYGITENTVKWHRQNLIHKLRCNNLEELVHWSKNNL